jgi:hypothetical protein
MAMKKRQRRSLVWVVLGLRKKRRRERRGAVEGGFALPLYRGQGGGDGQGFKGRNGRR